GWLAIAGVVVGSMLTVAYTLRFLWGAFATKAGVRTTDVTPVPAGFAASPVVLTVLTVALGFAGHTLTSLFEPHLAAYPEGHHHAELALWHGPGLPLLFSALAVLVGALLFRHRHSFAHLQGRLATSRSADGAYRAGMRWVDRTAVEVTGTAQRGSVAAYLAIILVVVLALPGLAALLALG